MTWPMNGGFDEDLDGDGYTNLEEYLNQTHPYRI